MARGFEGEHIDGGVILQLAARSVAIERTDPAYLSERAPHVRLLSSIVVDGDPTVAENNILANGTVVDTASTTIPRQTEFSRALGVGYKNTDLGFRPVPGITSANIKSQNRFGSLRTAEISFVVWSKDDLDNLEQLYLRPGYSCVLEFCHTVRVSNLGRIEREPVTLDNSIWSKKENDIVKQIKQKRVDSDYNYDGYFGFIRNFSWTFRQDGGYDCTVSMVTKGALIESINAAVYTDGIRPLDLDSDTSVEDTGSLSAGSISPLLGALLQISNQEEKKGYSVKQPVIEVDAGEDTPEGEFTYITMRSFLSLVNDLTLVYTKQQKRKPGSPFGPLPKVETTGSLREDGSDSNSIYFDTRSSEKMRTVNYGRGHYSIDAGVCMTQKPPAAGLQVRGEGGSPFFYGNVFRNRISTINIGSSDDILNIALNVEFLFRSIRAQMVSLSSKSVLEIVQIVLDEVERALGSINQFDITYDDETKKHTVVDRALVGYGKTSRGDKILPPIFPLTGKGAIAKSLTMASSISSNLASQIAIAATAAGSSADVLTTTNQDLVDWNRNLKDRWTSTLPLDAAVDQEELKAQIIEKGNVLNEFFRAQFPEKTAGPINYSKTSVQQAVNAFSAMKNYYLQKSKREKQKEIKGSLGGIIPITVSFEIDGIAGLKIGQTFRVSDKLIPSSYADKGVAFIINGLDETITSAGWVSNVSAQMFIVNPNINNS